MIQLQNFIYAKPYRTVYITNIEEDNTHQIVRPFVKYVPQKTKYLVLCVTHTVLRNVKQFSISLSFLLPLFRFHFHSLSVFSEYYKTSEFLGTYNSENSIYYLLVLFMINSCCIMLVQIKTSCHEPPVFCTITERRLCSLTWPVLTSSSSQRDLNISKFQLTLNTFRQR